MIEIALFILLCVCLYDLYTLGLRIEEQAEELKIHSRRLRNLEGQVNHENNHS